MTSVFFLIETIYDSQLTYNYLTKKKQFLNFFLKFVNVD